MPDPSLSKLYSARFSRDEKERKDRIWRVLCRHFFQRYVEPESTVLDMGAGYCEFINHIVCRRRIAFDLDVFPDGAIDVVFASNFFEHLLSKEDLLRTLAEIRRVLREGGKLLILQPNIRYTSGAYWDFFDHHLPLTERSLVEALELVGLKPTEVRARFLPFTSKSALPQHPFLVWLYLKVPIAHRIFGRQSWLVAVKP
jgi:SAM-dependent methyltransferase